MNGTDFLFQQANSINGALKRTDVVEQAKMLNAGKIARANAMLPSARAIGTSTNSNVYSATESVTNDYLVDQKLRNTGLYAKLKNKTIYSAESLHHASLNSGIF